MRIKYKYIIHKLTNSNNIKSNDYLKTLLNIMDSMNPKSKSKTKKSLTMKKKNRKTKRSTSFS